MKLMRIMDADVSFVGKASCQRVVVCRILVRKTTTRHRRRLRHLTPVCPARSQRRESDRNRPSKESALRNPLSILVM